MGGYYMQYLDGLCHRRGWHNPKYNCARTQSGFTCLVLVNGREYQTDLAYVSEPLAQENAAMRAFMVCRDFSANGGMLARNGVVQGLPAQEGRRTSRATPALDSRLGQISRDKGGKTSRHSPGLSSDSSNGSYEF